MATKSTTRKVGEIRLTRGDSLYADTLTGRAPKAYRTQTLTDRAEKWVRGEMDGAQEAFAPVTGIFITKGAKLEGTRSFKLVGQGSYRYAALYVTTEQEGRERLRGTCQACAGSQVVDGGVMVLHGYQRPGDGWINGRCIGTNHKPAEVTTELTTKLIADLRFAADYTEKSLPALEQEIRVYIAQHPHPRSPERQKHLTELNQTRSRRSSLVWNNRLMAGHLEQHALPQLGKPLTTEVV